VSLRFVGGWRQLGTGRASSAEGTLLVTRREASPEVELLGTTGSVLYGVALAQPLTVPSDDSSGRVVVRLLPGGRCDEHARGQATAPFDFELLMRVGDRRVLVPLPVPVPASNAAQTMLDRVCGKVVTAG